MTMLRRDSGFVCEKLSWRQRKQSWPVRRYVDPNTVDPPVCQSAGVFVLHRPATQPMQCVCVVCLGRNRNGGRRAASSGQRSTLIRKTATIHRVIWSVAFSVMA